MAGYRGNTAEATGGDGPPAHGDAAETFGVSRVAIGSIITHAIITTCAAAAITSGIASVLRVVALAVPHTLAATTASRASTDGRHGGGQPARAQLDAASGSQLLASHHTETRHIS